jgi:DNA polymerase bacteriophage-type
MQYVFIDFETRSTIDVTDVGATYYARHASTIPLICCYAIDGGEIETVTDFESDPFVGLEDCTFVAHNIGFERAIIWYCLPHWNFPERWIDTAAMARRAGLPGSLDGAATALNLEHLKDTRGKALIRLFSMLQKPTKKSGQSKPHFVNIADRQSEFREFIDYCKLDVATERDLFWSIGPEIMTPSEQAALERNIISNERGIQIDTLALRNMIRIIESEEKRACVALNAITEGAITTPNQVAKIAEFCGMPGISAMAVKELLDNPDDLDAESAAVLRIRQDVGRSSVKKAYALNNRVTPNNRAHDLTIYHAAHTGRETGTGPQPLNMPRGRFTGRYADMCEAIYLIRQNDVNALRLKYGSVLDAVSSCLRGMFIASPGKTLYCADMSSIEARLVFWFAGETRTLQSYREGVDLYKVLACDIYSKALDAVTKPEREIGKRGILGLGFGMGARRFVGMVKEQSGLDIELSLAEKAKTAYRNKYKLVPRLWYAIEKAAKRAVATRETVQCGRVSYHLDRQWLVCTLPSGRDLRYFQPQIDEDQQLTYMGLVAAKGRRVWKREHTYGGKLVENMVQATARDLLQVFMARIESGGYDIVLTVYDEIVCEKSNGSLEEIIEVMSAPAPWCSDLPLGAEGWQGKRYRK